jgi:Cu2+-exporting ATPase
MCCNGCLAVADLIFNSGLDRYYQFRQAEGRKASDDRERAQLAWRSCDDRENLWGTRLEDGSCELLLQTEGIRCAACSWLIRSQLEGMAGIEDVQVDTASGYTQVHWNPGQTRLSNIAMGLMELGYKPHLPIASEEERQRKEERRASLLRLGIAGLGMMQVMTYAVGLYAGDYLGMPLSAQRFLEWVSLIVTTPVVLFSGRGFFQGAWISLKARRPGMDVPVALAIGVAYTASCINFFRGDGEVWFDSVVMFIFFLLIGRHVELVLRQRNQQAGAVLARLLPEWAERVEAIGTETVPTDMLKTGDHVLVRPGEAFPADGCITQGDTSVNEALLTGESHPLERSAGDDVIAGSINLDQPVQVEVTNVGHDATISALGRLLNRARATRSRTTELSERFASWFVIVVIILASASGLWWYQANPAMVMPVVLSVLVISCPCALSLATPAVVAAASRRMLQQGIILSRGSAIESLTQATRVVFDKTGTLTTGEPILEEIVLNPQRQSWTQERVMRVAAALEASSSHPLARAFGTAGALPEVGDVHVQTASGISGDIEGERYRIGSATFVGVDKETEDTTPEKGSVWLADTSGWLAVFELSDGLREGAVETVAAFHAAGLRPAIISGDHRHAVRQVADQLDITDWHSGQQPDMKLARLAELKQQGQMVMMVGDGVNDAPVLAAADISVAVQGGTELANSAADLILTGRSLTLVWRAREIALSARRIISQNLWWAVGYNVAAIPLAFSGMLEPWMAALGMSASSLVVVLNAARLKGVDGVIGQDSTQPPAEMVPT